nr:unnamed protein product [Digitaria exilis]
MAMEGDVAWRRCALSGGGSRGAGWRRAEEPRGVRGYYYSELRENQSGGRPSAGYESATAAVVAFAVATQALTSWVGLPKPN